MLTANGYFDQLGNYWNSRGKSMRKFGIVMRGNRGAGVVISYVELNEALMIAINEGLNEAFSALCRSGCGRKLI